MALISVIGVRFLSKCDLSVPTSTHTRPWKNTITYQDVYYFNQNICETESRIKIWKTYTRWIVTKTITRIQNFQQFDLRVNGIISGVVTAIYTTNSSSKSIWKLKIAFLMSEDDLIDLSNSNVSLFLERLTHVLTKVDVESDNHSNNEVWDINTWMTYMMWKVLRVKCYYIKSYILRPYFKILY